MICCSLHGPTHDKHIYCQARIAAFRTENAPQIPETISGRGGRGRRGSRGGRRGGRDARGDLGGPVRRRGQGNRRQTGSGQNTFIPISRMSVEQMRQELTSMHRVTLSADGCETKQTLVVLLNHHRMNTTGVSSGDVSGIGGDADGNGGGGRVSSSQASSASENDELNTDDDNEQ